MAANKPLISIGMPVYNGEKFLRQALDSLLAQDYRNFELIISDNASTDNTADICREYAARDHRIHFHQNDRNRGATYNFSRVRNLASGKYSIWAADHDLWHPTLITKCVEVLENDPEVVLAYPRGVRIDVANNPLHLCHNQIDTRKLSPPDRFRRI
ncbi:MAG: glycosyltransferase, partial [Syntrophales bacterium]|nr:glycosyltransferase [Syntrophales bacterium]